MYGVDQYEIKENIYWPLPPVAELLKPINFLSYVNTRSIFFFLCENEGNIILNGVRSPEQSRTTTHHKKHPVRSHRQKTLTVHTQQEKGRTSPCPAAAQKLGEMATPSFFFPPVKLSRLSSVLRTLLWFTVVFLS